MSSPASARYRVRADLRVVCMADELAFLITETERRRSVGQLSVRLLSILSEPLSFESIARRLEPEFSAEVALYGLEQLLELGYVEDAADEAGSAYPLPPRRGASVPLSLEFVGSRTEPAIARTLAECGFSLAPAAEMTLLVVEDYLDPRLGERLAELEEQATGAYLPFKPYGSIAWLGPLFVPGSGPCWACALSRLQTNRPIEMYLQGEGHPIESLLPRALGSEASLSAATLFAGFELSRWSRQRSVSGNDEIPARDLLTLELENMTRRVRQVIRRPQCPRCGDPGLMKARLQRPLELASRKKVDISDGGQRIESAEGTYRRLARHVDSLVGLVTDLSELPQKSQALGPVYSASHSLRPASHEATPDERFQQLSVGNGRTAAQARTSALCGALERQCARFQGDELRVRRSLHELGSRAIDPRQLLLFSERQYLTQPDRGRSRSLVTPRSQLVPRVFDPARAIDWTPSWSLSQRVQKLVPFAYVFAGAPRAAEEQVCNWDSNGCAAGNCLEEAILQGLLELIERDAAAIWWYNGLERPGLELESFDEPYFMEVREHYERAGYELWLLDLTHDLEIPVVIALAAERSGQRFAAGLGCHLDLRLAAQRAVTELHRVFDPERRNAPLFTRAELSDERFLRPVPRRSGRALGQRPPASTDLRRDIEFCMTKLARAGLELLVTDYSRPDVQLSTVKVMVPGLRQLWPRFAPGRLYDVPVALGALSRPLSESELNPLPLLM
ncbi:MAG TPA: TOMM precursor leader peptide-binding protein [Polyangiaceae bacterium]|nr:TOMM precursor leader peptide-binding protein [Polyangiaceae bacterium]